MLPNDGINPILDATVQATEEAIVSDAGGGDDDRADGRRVYALPHDRLRAALRTCNRLFGRYTSTKR